MARLIDPAKALTFYEPGLRPVLKHGGFLTRDQGKLRAFAITCPHLGCSYAFDDGKKHFVCPCHGSEFALDGSVLHGPATSPLSHLTWQTGPATNEIEVDGLGDYCID